MAAPGDLRLTDLPNEILLNIFSYLSYSERIEVRHTCRRFGQLTLDPSLWKAITIDVDLLVCDEEALQQYDKHMSLMLSQRYYRELCTEKESGAEDNQGLLMEDTVEVKNAVTAVQETGRVLPSCSVTGQSFYPNLKRISLNIPELPQADFLVRYSALRHLDVVLRFWEAEHVVIPKIAQMFNVLKVLKELQTLIFQVPEHTYNTEVNESIRNYFLSGPKLKHIELSVAVDGDTVKAIVDHCSEINFLEFGDSKFTSGDFMAALKKPSLLMSTLRLPNCTRLDNKCLKPIALAFPNLENLVVSLTSKTPYEGINFLFRSCPRLTSLELSISMVDDDEDERNRANQDAPVGNNVSGRCLHELARIETTGKLQKLELTKFLSLSEHVFTDLCKNQHELTDVLLLDCGVSDKDIMLLAENCRRLRNVDICYCPQVGPTAVAALLNELPKLQKLTWLHNGSLLKLDDLLPLLTITRPTRQHKLEHLSLGPCTNVTGSRLSALLSLCPNILVLRIQADVSLDDACIMWILRRCALLEVLQIHRSHEVSGGEQETLSDASLRYIQRMGLRLQHVWLPYSPLFSDRVLAQTVLHFDKLVFCLWTTRERRSEISDLQQSFELEMRGLRGRKKSVRCWWIIEYILFVFSVTRFRSCASDHRLRFLLDD